MLRSLWPDMQHETHRICLQVTSALQNPITDSICLHSIIREARTHDHEKTTENVFINLFILKHIQQTDFDFENLKLMKCENSSSKYR